MALIPCYECGAKISNQADSCPQCGANRVPPAVKDLLERKKLNDRIEHYSSLFLIFVLLMIVVFFDKFRDNSLGGFVVGIFLVLTHLSHKRWKQRNNSIYEIFDKLRNENEWK